MVSILVCCGMVHNYVAVSLHSLQVPEIQSLKLLIALIF